MSSRKHSTEQIIRKLREAEIELAKGRSVREVCKHLGVTDQTYYRWRKEYGGIRTDQARRLKELERENGRLKKVVADLTLDNVILKEAAASLCRPYSQAISMIRFVNAASSPASFGSYRCVARGWFSTRHARRSDTCGNLARTRSIVWRRRAGLRSFPRPLL